MLPIRAARAVRFAHRACQPFTASTCLNANAHTRLCVHQPTTCITRYLDVAQPKNDGGYLDVDDEADEGGNGDEDEDEEDEAEEEAEIEDQAAQRDATSPLRVLVTSFVILFTAEWGDLSQLLTAGLAARTGDPVAIGDVAQTTAAGHDRT